MSSSLSERLASMAHGTLVADLTDWGNTLSADHSLCLKKLLEDFTDMALGSLRGRFAWGIPTGMGKSAAVVAWVSSVAKLGKEAEDTSVAIAASKVEALCELKRSMIAHGVDPQDIALIHSFRHDPRRAKAGHTGFASEPSDHGCDRRFVLVSHSRVHGVSDAWMNHKGHQRSLLVWDESLMVSSATGLSVAEIRGSVGFVAGYYKTRATHRELIEYLHQTERFIEDTLAGLTDEADSRTLELPGHPKAEEWVPLIGHDQTAGPIVALLEMSGKLVRIVKAAGNGILSYQISVPSTISNILILDASYPVRQLERLDASISDGAIRHPGLSEVLARVKNFQDVTIHRMSRPGGRHSMTSAFNEKKHNSGIVRSIVDVIRNVPPAESILIFLYKTRGGNRSGDFTEILTKALEAAGINTREEAKQADGTPFDPPRQRVCLLSWGNESGTNAYNHCATVILAGILHRSRVDLMASVVGQLDELDAKIPKDLFHSVDLGERTHLAYQACSRGTCRMVDNGQAAPMHAWIIEKSKDFQEVLGQTMPGARWLAWSDGNDNGTKAAKVAAVVAEHLKGLQVKKVSTTALRKALGLSGVKPYTFAAGIAKALEASPDWIREGRSLVSRSAA